MNHRLAFALVMGGAVGIGGQAWAQSAPPVGTLRMPLVSPEKADQFFSTRVVPPSNVPAKAPLAAAQPRQRLNVEPVLGHDLPSDAVTAAGLPRADFATAKSGKAQKKSPLGDKITVGARVPGTAVAPQPPLTISKP